MRPPDSLKRQRLNTVPAVTLPGTENESTFAPAANGWLAADALVVVERPTRGGDWRWPPGVDVLRARRYGEATLWYGRAGSPLQPDGE